MKIPRGTYVALGFVFLLVVLTGGVWLYQQFAVPTGTGAEAPRGAFGSLFPFGGDTNTGPTETGTDVAQVPRGSVPRLRQVSVESVAGSTFASTTRGTMLRFVERNTGHV